MSGFSALASLSKPREKIAVVASVAQVVAVLVIAVCVYGVGDVKKVPFEKAPF